MVEPSDVRHLVRVHSASADRGAGAFTIVPARDELGSNAVLCSPAGAVPLRFGDNSFFPHLDAAKAHGIEPEVVHLPRIALDIDTPEDLALFVRTPSQTRAYALLQQWRLRLDDAGPASNLGMRPPADITPQGRRYLDRSPANLRELGRMRLALSGRLEHRDRQTVVHRLERDRDRQADGELRSDRRRPRC